MILLGDCPYVIWVLLIHIPRVSLQYEYVAVICKLMYWLGIRCFAFEIYSEKRYFNQEGEQIDFTYWWETPIDERVLQQPYWRSLSNSLNLQLMHNFGKCRVYRSRSVLWPHWSWELAEHYQPTNKLATHHKRRKCLRDFRWIEPLLMYTPSAYRPRGPNGPRVESFPLNCGLILICAAKSFSIIISIKT